MDNRYFNYGCPPLMSDSRFLTSYVDSDVLDQYIRHVNKIESSHDYRLFLQKNANKIMNREKAYLMQKNTCNLNDKDRSSNSDSQKCRGTCECNQNV